MPNVNYKKLYAIKKNNEKRILSVCPRMKTRAEFIFTQGLMKTVYLTFISGRALTA